VVQVNRGVERRQVALPGPDRRGEQGVYLPDVERIAAMACPLAMVRVFAPRLASRCQGRLEGRSNAPSRIAVA
jgi:hypothetical protein